MSQSPAQGARLQYPAGDAGEVLAIFDAAAQPILGDRQAWAEEEANRSAAPLPWPLKSDGKGYEQLLRILATATVDNVLDAIREAHGPHAVPPTDPASPEFQLILRMVKRATDAGEAALRQRFGGSGRMSLRRDLANFAKRVEAEAAIRSGLPRAEAFKRAGLSRAGAYRALRRKR